MSQLAKDSGLAALAMSRKTAFEILEDIPEDKYCHQLVEGGNHALWIMGHLAHADDFFLTTFKPRETKLSQSWHDLFGMGSKPVADKTAYPSMTEIKDMMATHGEELANWFGSMTDDQLQSELPEDWRTFAPSFAALMSKIAWHDGLHTGQLTMIRRNLGIAPKFG